MNFQRLNEKEKGLEKPGSDTWQLHIGRLVFSH
jgi:hypothetical protein